MVNWSKFSKVSPQTLAPEVVAQPLPVEVENEKGVGGVHAAARSVTVDSDTDDDVIHKDMQAGVQKAEAMAQVWTKKSLVTLYAL